MRTSDFLDPVALAEEIKAELEIVEARLDAADHRPLTHTSATIKRAGTVNNVVATHLAARVARKLSEFEQRLAAAEQRKGLHYRGVWRGDVEYGHGDAATHSGGLWVCERQGTRSKPGDSSGAWRLASKKDFA